MKKMKKCSKGFTLTELAVVIAVIAILIAVLVPTFISILDSANVSADKQLVKNLNTALSIEGATGNIETPADALDAVAESGYSVDKLETESDSEIIYDQVTNTFALLAEGKVTYPENSGIDVNASTTWYFASSQSEIAENATVSYILTGEWGSSQASTHSAQTAKTGVKNAAATTVTGAAVTYSGEGGIDTSRASGIATVNYEYKGTATGATVILNITTGSLYIELSSTIGTVTINNYSSEEVTTAVSGSSSSATVSLNNVNGSACYVETAVSGKVTYSGNEDSYSVVVSVDNSTGTVEVGSKAYPYLLASEEDLAKKMSYGGYYLVTESFTSTTAVTIASGTEVILDLGGYTLTISGTTTAFTSGDSTFYASIINNGALFITDSSANVGELALSGASYGIYNVGNFVLECGKINATYSAANAIISQADKATITVNGGEIYAERRAIYNNIGSVEVNGGTISSSASYTNSFGLYNNTYLVINGGEISGYYGVYNNGTSSAATVYINGGSISGSYCGMSIKSGTVSIGSLNADNSQINISGDYVALDVDYATTLDVYSGTITGAYGINCFGRYSNNYTILSIYGGIITATSGFAVCGNGSTGLGYEKIYIYGGTMTSTTGPAIYNPQQDGVTYIYGGTITGISGVEVRNGEVHIGEEEGKTIDALVITATGNPESITENYNGSTTVGMAIAVATYNLKDINVTIGEGVYTGKYSIYEDNVNNYENVTVSTNITVTSGTFKGIVYTENSSISISGGIFTDNTNLSDCVASGYAVSDKNEANYYEIIEANIQAE